MVAEEVKKEITKEEESKKRQPLEPATKQGIKKPQEEIAAEKPLSEKSAPEERRGILGVILRILGLSPRKKTVKERETKAIQEKQPPVTKKPATVQEEKEPVPAIVQEEKELVPVTTHKKIVGKKRKPKPAMKARPVRKPRQAIMKKPRELKKRKPFMAVGVARLKRTRAGSARLRVLLKSFRKLNKRVSLLEEKQKSKGLSKREERAKKILLAKIVELTNHLERVRPTNVSERELLKNITKLKQVIAEPEEKEKKQVAVVGEQKTGKNIQPKIIGLTKQIEELKTTVALPEKREVSGKELEEEIEVAVAYTDAEVENAIDTAEHTIKQIKMDFLKKRLSEKEYKKLSSTYSSKLEKLKEKKRKLEKQARAPKKLGKGIAKKRVVDEEHFREIESHIGELLKKYNISIKEIEKDAGKLGKEKILMDFHKLINVIDILREVMEIESGLRAGGVKPGMPVTSFNFPSGPNLSFNAPGGAGVEKSPALEVSTIYKQKKEKLVATAKEIKKYRIVTDFDRLLALVQEKGRISAKEAEDNLKISKEYFEELAEILEKNGLVKIFYPPIGDMSIVDIQAKTKKEKPDIMQLLSRIRQKPAARAGATNKKETMQQISSSKQKKPATTQEPKKDDKRVKEKNGIMTLIRRTIKGRKR